MSENPLPVTPSAELDLAVEGALFSGFGTAGQRCTSLGAMIGHESVHADFLARFTAPVAAARVWAGSSRTTTYAGRPDG